MGDEPPGFPVLFMKGPNTLNRPEGAIHAPDFVGRLDYEGELAVQELLERYFIVRIAWVFGVNGKNFIKTMLSLGKTFSSLEYKQQKFL